MQRELGELISAQQNAIGFKEGSVYTDINQRNLDNSVQLRASAMNAEYWNANKGYLAGSAIFSGSTMKDLLTDGKKIKDLSQDEIDNIRFRAREAIESSNGYFNFDYNDSDIGRLIDNLVNATNVDTHGSKAYRIRGLSRRMPLLNEFGEQFGGFYTGSNIKEGTAQIDPNTWALGNGDFDGDTFMGHLLFNKNKWDNGNQNASFDERYQNYKNIMKDYDTVARFTSNAALIYDDMQKGAFGNNASQTVTTEKTPEQK